MGAYEKELEGYIEEDGFKRKKREPAAFTFVWVCKRMREGVCKCLNMCVLRGGGHAEWHQSHQAVLAAGPLRQHLLGWTVPVE